MATRPKYSRFYVTAGFLSLTAVVGGCDGLQRPQERVYTVYVDMHAGASPSGHSTARPPEPEMLNPDAAAAETPVAALTPTPAPTPVPTSVPKPKPKPTAVQSSKSALEVKELHAQTLEEMQRRGLLLDDLKDGRARLAAIAQKQQRRDYDTALALLRSLQSDIRSTQVDEAFITQKNARLLTLIQEVKPAPELQAQIDRESEAINQLLEQSDYDAINRRMNQLFNLLNH